VRQQTAADAISQDPFVREAQAQLDAQIIEIPLNSYNSKLEEVKDDEGRIRRLDEAGAADAGKYEKAQDELAKVEVEGQAGSGMVKSDDDLRALKCAACSLLTA